ncbi:hypothetical protein [Flavihumibacter sp. UBA7668]|uniref:hypothetical protein n=1 Tax=Flavihumibacter sp. UBA7668 TaxID=1946542 RepID=UPI0025BD8480|nr:hypothetical protein [Flavihumibacter sp. UBA7668]
MKRTILLATILLLNSFNVISQINPIEILAGHDNLFYQHNVSLPIRPNSKFSLVHVMNAMIPNEKTEGKKTKSGELMNQLYAGYALHPSIKFLTGVFYSNATDYRSSIAISFSKKNRKTFYLISPRIDYSKTFSYELFALIEYRFKFNKNLTGYSRFQTMYNRSKDHNRSYQRMRFGLDFNTVQIGIGTNLEAYGSEHRIVTNHGMFLRKLL